MANPTPFFVAPGGGDRATGERLLLVSDQFPPAQSAGALRWQKLSSYAAERGWTLDVVTRHPSTLARQDAARLAELPPGTRVYGIVPHAILGDKLEAAIGRAVAGLRGARTSVTAAEGSAALSPRTSAGEVAEGRPVARRPDSLPPDALRFAPLELRSWLRAWWAWLDYRRQGAWARQAEAMMLDVYRPDVHRAVVSCGPWHFSAHEAARRVAQQTGLPFVMDLRDPWSLRRRMAETAASPLWYRLADFHERRAVEQASLVVVNAEAVH
ncbi:MAG: hypothetical protein M3373_14615, partial [Gemmatimonadota bacterium]|nr:hypothetical protein [Gemmatimonadota bacterium]